MKGRAAGIALGLAFAMAGAVSWTTARHARSLTTFVPGAAPLPDFDHLTWLQRLDFAVRGPTLPRPENRRTPLELGVEFRTERAEASDGTRLEAWVLPREAARGEIVMVPGYRASRDSLLDAAVLLHDAGWRVTMIDPRGVGGSDGHRTTLGWDESLDVAAWTAIAQERTTGPVVVYGFSMGGAAALRSVALGQAVAEAVIVEATFATLRDAMAARLHHMGAPATPAADLLLFWSWVDTGVPGWEHNPLEDVEKVRVPLLVLQGSEDWRAPPSAGRALAEAAPKGRYAEISGVGHQSGALARPISWQRAVEGFLMETFADLPDDAPAER